MACDGSLRTKVGRFLYTDVGQRVLAEYRLGVQVGRHESTIALQRLKSGDEIEAWRKCSGTRLEWTANVKG